MKERLERFKKWSKKAGREVYYFVSSGIFLKNFGGIVALTTVFFLLTLWWINCYTKHGEALHIQDYVGMDIEDAIDKASSSSFEIVINDSTFIRKKKPGVILSQDPKPASQVKKNRKIYVSITKMVPDQTILPNLKGGNDDYDNFRKKCERKEIDTEIKKEVYSNKLEPNTIMQVYFEDEDITNKINDGFEIPKGSIVQCVITKRGGGTVQIPELVCKNYEAATFLINTSSLNIGSVIEDNTVTDKNSAYIWKQEPRYNPGGRLQVGEQISVFLTQFKPESCTNLGQNIEAPDED